MAISKLVVVNISASQGEDERRVFCELLALAAPLWLIANCYLLIAGFQTKFLPAPCAIRPGLV